MNLPLLKSSKKAKPKKHVEQNPFEMLTDGFIESVKEDLVRGGVSEAKTEIFKTEPTHSHGEMKAGHEIDLSNHGHSAEHPTSVITEMGRQMQQEIIHAGRISESRTTQETSVKIQEILIEIKQLANSSAQLKKQVEVISLEQTAGKPGKYHMNLVEFVLAKIRDARMDVEDSLAWFQALGSKKKSRQYHSMAKKHGTSFTLSGERTPSTSSVG